MDSLISIIIPTFNRAHIIGETLASVSAQTHSNWECIVVDDGSTDNTPEILKEYVENDGRFKYYMRPNHLPKGANSCRNYGFEMSQGDFVNWFDSDDIMLPNFLKCKMDAMTDSLEFVYCSGFYVNDQLEDRKKITLIETNNIYKDYALWNLHLFTPSMLFRKSFLVDKPLFNTQIVRFQDTEFFSRVFFGMMPEVFKAVHEYQFLYRRHPKSKSSTDEIYVHSEQLSVSYIYLSKLKQGLALGDAELAAYFYKRTIALWFRAFRNNHKENQTYIKKELLTILATKNKWNVVIIRSVFSICSLVNTPSHKMKTLLESLTLRM